MFPCFWTKLMTNDCQFVCRLHANIQIYLAMFGKCSNGPETLFSDKLKGKEVQCKDRQAETNIVFWITQS